MSNQASIERCDHGVPTTYPCTWCRALWAADDEQERRRRLRRETVRELLKAVVPSLSTAVDLCARIYELRHAGAISREVDRTLGSLIAQLVRPVDLDVAVEAIALEIESAERRGYTRGACDERGRLLCSRDVLRRRPRGPRSMNPSVDSATSCDGAREARAA